MKLILILMVLSLDYADAFERRIVSVYLDVVNVTSSNHGADNLLGIMFNRNSFNRFQEGITSSTLYYLYIPLLLKSQALNVSSKHLKFVVVAVKLKPRCTKGCDKYLRTRRPERMSYLGNKN